jgi:hypothetical protein
VPSLTVTHATDGNVSEFNATSTSNGIFYAVLTGTARPFREAGLEPFAVTPAGTPANVPRFDGNPERLRVDSDAIAGNPAINVATGAVVSGLTGPLALGIGAVGAAAYALNSAYEATAAATAKVREAEEAYRKALEQSERILRLNTSASRDKAGELP